MYLTCTKADLSTALTHLAKVSTQKSVLPILSYVLLTTEKGSLVVTTTDLSLALRCRLPAQIQRGGAVCIPAKLLSDIVKNEPGDMLNLQRDGKYLSLTSFSEGVESRTRLKSMNPEDFPQLPKRDDEEKRLTLDSTAFKKILGSVLPFATRTTQSGDTTSNVQFTLSQDRLAIAATDHYRMAIGSLPLKNDDEEGYSFLLGEELLRKVLPILPENERIHLATSKELVSLALPGFSLYMRVSHEPFVDTTKSLEGVPETTITVDRSKLAKALKRLASMIEDKKSYGDVYSAQIETHEGELILSPRRKREGVETSLVPLGAQVEGPHILYNFERKWLSDLVGKMDGVGTITLAFSREKETLLLRPLVPNGLIYVMKVEDATKVTQEKNPGVDEKNNEEEKVSHPSS